MPHTLYQGCPNYGPRLIFNWPAGRSISHRPPPQSVQWKWPAVKRKSAAVPEREPEEEQNVAAGHTRTCCT
ncbi:hypothetical protein XELAEV_18022868mg [Xenopus laevis]|uniref:Uncharacterized protein n=1 Tax=Xenopus laevis TaxID=8355 RepID=A0A974D428_XENLA|nr:hypothetical protein XELAEV_18022868mg [Xenopus laevis]